MPSPINVDLAHPWDDDDPSAFVGLPTAWPHDDRPTDEASCPSCYWYAYWTEKDDQGHDAFDMLAQNYPLRFQAIIDHRNAVRRSKAAAGKKRGPTA